MKKSSLVSAIVAGIAFILFGVSAFFVKWKRDAFDATPSAIITSIIAFAIVCIVFVLFVLLLEKKSKLLMTIPPLGIFFVNIVFTKAIDAPADNSVLSMLSPSQGSVLSLLLAVAFITSIVFIQLKNYKWASLVAIIYSVVLVVITFNYSSELIFSGDKLALFYSLGALFALASLVIFFAAPLIPNNEIVIAEKPKKEKVEEAPAKEVKEETKAPVEEAKEETEAPAEENKEAEAPAEEAETEEKDDEEEKEKSEPQDPFKNQYASSETVFDVQENAEDKE